MTDFNLPWLLLGLQERFGQGNRFHPGPGANQVEQFLDPDVRVPFLGIQFGSRCCRCIQQALNGTLLVGGNGEGQLIDSHLVGAGRLISLATLLASAGPPKPGTSQLISPSDHRQVD